MPVDALAAVLTAAGDDLDIRSVRVDDPAPSEVRVRVEACGLCHSDLHYLNGDLATPYPVILGHEAAGVVDAVGSAVTGFAPGDRVVTCMSAYCGTCAACHRGETWLCARRDQPPVMRGEGPARITLDDTDVAQGLGIGGLSEMVLVHEHALAPVPDDLPAHFASLLGCGVLTGFGAVVNAARLEPGESLVVIGCGGVGLAAVNTAAVVGAGTIVAVDRNPDALALASDLGATHTLLADDTGPGARDIRLLVDGGADHAIEAIGLKSTIELACSVVRPGGQTSLVGIAAPGVTFEVPALATVWLNRRIQGVLMGASHFPRDIPRLARLALEGRLRLDLLATGTLPLVDVGDGFDRMRAGHGGRLVVDLR